ncbi:MAG: sigma-70 family RNA polymerase sigma factor [Mangrovibacterium sp.]
MIFKEKQPGISQKEQLFSIFFKQNYHRALLLAFRFMKDEMIAKDIVQEVFLSLWEKREELVFSAELRPYLFASVKNRCLNDLYLHHKNIPISQIKESSGYIMDEIPEEDERLIKLAGQISKLPPRCREIFELVIFKGMKYQEAADFLQISLNTVKTQMRIAYHMLRNIF